MIDFFSRLDNYMKYKGLNDNKMTLETGVSNGLIGKARLRGSLSQDNISKILHTYSELDANWLLTGNGSMLKEGVKSRLSQNITGNSNIQSGNDTNVTGDCKQKIEDLQKQLEEKKNEIEWLKELTKTLANKSK